MFLSLVNQNALGCWNTNRPLRTIGLVQKDDRKMIYPCDVKVYGDKVYLLTNTMPEFLYGKLNYNKKNFRVWSNDVMAATAGTSCENRRGSYVAASEADVEVRPGGTYSGGASEAYVEQKPSGTYKGQRPSGIYRGQRPMSHSPIA